MILEHFQTCPRVWIFEIDFVRCWINRLVKTTELTFSWQVCDLNVEAWAQIRFVSEKKQSSEIADADSGRCSFPESTKNRRNARSSSHFIFFFLSWNALRMFEQRLNSAGNTNEAWAFIGLLKFTVWTNFKAFLSLHCYTFSLRENPQSSKWFSFSNQWSNLSELFGALAMELNPSPNPT